MDDGRIETRGYIAEVWRDEYPEDPRQSFDHVAVLALGNSRGRYILGDMRVEDIPEDEWADALYKAEIGLLDHSGLYLYIDGGSHWSDSAGWDSGTIGYAYIPNTRAGEIPSDVTPRDIIEQELNVYNSYLSGDVWGFEIRDSDGEVVDSCGGIYGYDYAREEMEAGLDTILAATPEQLKLFTLEVN